MTFLPIVERELRVAARRMATYGTRLAMACGAIFVGAWILFFAVNVAPMRAAYYIFQGLSGLALTYCLLYGRQATADCLSGEKREGTLGLLFLTDLKGYDVVLGKLVATSLNGFYGLLAVFPVLAVPLLMGGISNGEFWRVVLVLVNSFLLSLAAGILVSAMSRDPHRAMGGNFLLLLLITGAPASVAGLIAAYSPTNRVVHELLLSCPVYSFLLCPDTEYRLHAGYFWWSAGILHGLTWLMVLLAAWIVPRSWQDRPVRGAEGRRGKDGRVRRSWLLRWSARNAARQTSFRRRMLDRNAYSWLAARPRLKAAMPWTFLGLMGAWWLIGGIVERRTWLDPALFVLTALMLNATLKVWVILEASTRLAEDRRIGSLELLLSTPLSVTDLLAGQWLALRRLFLGPLVVVLVTELVLLILHNRLSPDPANTPIWLSGMAILVLDLAACGFAGMRQALTARNQNRAVVGASVRILMLPWVIYGIIFGFITVWSALTFRRSWSPSWQFGLRLWVGLSLAADLIFGLSAWYDLRYRLRVLALRGFSPHEPRFGAWWARRTAAPDPAAPPAPAGKAAAAPAARAASPRRRRRRLAFAAVLLLAAAGAWIGWRRANASPKYPPPVVVTLASSNAPLSIVTTPTGALLLPPDGSLWYCGAETPGFSEAPVPVRIGSSAGWRKVEAGAALAVGLRADGSLWRWGPGLGKDADHALPVGTNRDWVDVATAANYAAALRADGTLWGWGSSAFGGGGGTAARPAGKPARKADELEAPPVQIGTNRDWTSVSSTWSGLVALRQDGSMWAWGGVWIVSPMGNRMANLPQPTRLCLDTNWLAMAGRYPLMALTRSGELWELLHSAPDPAVPVAVSGSLLATNVVLGRCAVAFRGEHRLFTLHPDGSLWERSIPVLGLKPSANRAERRVGERSDWVALYGEGRTAFGVTSDGTVWLWGYDPSRQSNPDFLTQVRIIQTRVRMALAGSPTAGRLMYYPGVQMTPRPLMRLVPP